MKGSNRWLPLARRTVPIILLGAVSVAACTRDLVLMHPGPPLPPQQGARVELCEDDRLWFKVNMIDRTPIHWPAHAFELLPGRHSLALEVWLHSGGTPLPGASGGAKWIACDLEPGVYYLDPQVDVQARTWAPRCVPGRCPLRRTTS